MTHASGSRVPAAMSYHNGRNQGILPNGDPASHSSWIPVLLITYHNGRSLGIFRNGEQVRMLRRKTGTLVICLQIRENLTMENGDAAASWKDPASCLLDNGRNAGKCRQWSFLLHRSQRPFFLPFIPEIRDIFTMEKGYRARDQDASCWNRIITWSTDGQCSNGGWASPLMQSSRTSDPG